MELIDKILKETPKDNDGLDDLDKFWELTEKISFQNLRRLTSKKKSHGSKSTQLKKNEVVDSESDFDYDNETDSITDDDDYSISEDKNDFAKKSDESPDAPSQSIGDKDPSFNFSKSIAFPSDDSLRKALLEDKSLNSNTSNDKVDLSESVNLSSRSSLPSNNSLDDRSISNESDRPDDSLASQSSSNRDLTTPKSSRSLSKITSANTSRNSKTFVLDSPEGLLDDVSFDLSTVNKSSSTRKSSRFSKSIGSSRRVSFEADMEMEDLSPIKPNSSIKKKSRSIDNESEVLSPEQSNDQDYNEGLVSQTDMSSVASPKIPGNSSSSSKLLNTSTPENDGKSRLSIISTPGSNAFPRGTKIKDDSYIDGDVDTDVEDDTTYNHITDISRDGPNDSLDQSSFSPDNSFLYTISSANKKYIGKKLLEENEQDKHSRLKKSHRLISSDEEIELDSENETNSEDSNDRNIRRSKRATKGRRFAFWKGERPIYEEGTMVGLLQADPTPAKKIRRNVHKISNNDKARTALKFDDEADFINFPPIEYPKGIKYIDRNKCENLTVWDDENESESIAKVISIGESNHPGSALPITAKRPKGKDKVGFAAHSFNVPEIPGQMSGWISGFVNLPPEAIKDAEGVGRYSQVFFVSDCQDNSLELGIADPKVDSWNDKTAQRVLLKKGDSFYIPPENIYRLENHSKAKQCSLFWTIIKPIEESNNQSNDSVPTEIAVANGRR